MYAALDAFVSSVSAERLLLEEKRTLPHHPNILLILTSGISNKEVEASIRRYIPRSDIFPCDDHPLVIPSFPESDLSGSYIRPSSPGLLDWETDSLDGQPAERRSPDRPAQPSSPSIGQPVQFPNLAHFARSSTVFHHHYTAAGGECPGRATLLTGQLPPIHGVRTSLEKQGIRGELRIDEVPTLGHYLSAVGYDVVYKGAWGLSEVQALQEHPLLELLGVDRSDEDLQPYGFTEWEAHEDASWYERCIKITTDAVECIRRRESVMSSESMRGSCPPPWALVVSYPDVMPRVENEGNWQVVLRDGDLSPLRGSWTDFAVLQKENPSLGLTGSLSCGNLHRLDADASPPPLFALAPSAVAASGGADAPELPRVQKHYRDYCSQVASPDSSFSRNYHAQVAKLDNLLGELLQEVLRSDASNTLILFTSTTGNLVGDHGLWGSCYCGYEGAIQVPFILHLPPRLSGQRAPPRDPVAAMTSSIDVLPTLLSLAGVDVSEAQKRLRITHKKVLPLPGRDLFRDDKPVAIYYQSEDVAMPIHPAQPSAHCVLPLFEGPANHVVLLSRSIAVLIAQLHAAGQKGPGRRVKLCYYSSDPRSASNCRALTEEREKEWEWELFDLDRDADEVRTSEACHVDMQSDKREKRARHCEGDEEIARESVQRVVCDGLGRWPV